MRPCYAVKIACDKKQVSIKTKKGVVKLIIVEK